VTEEEQTTEPAVEGEATFAGAEAEASAPITNANQLRMQKFRELMHNKWSWIGLIGIPVVAGGVFAALEAPFVGGIVFVVAIILMLLIIFYIADGQAEDAFYDSYCSTHGLERATMPFIDSYTPLLRKGDKTNTDEVFTGELAPGLNGDLILWTYTEVSRDSDGDETETDYPFTFVHVEMPEIIEHMSDLHVDRAGFKMFDGLQDKFLGDFERVTLESDALADRFEIFVRKGQDPIWVRRLFSPTFIVWLAENPIKNFAFELENGHLVAYVPGHMDTVDRLEEVTTVGSFVASRLREEVAQTSPRESEAT